MMERRIEQKNRERNTKTEGENGDVAAELKE
jgi:hypothetical protein